MADDQDASNDVSEGGDAPEASDYDETSVPAVIESTTASSLLDEYDDDNAPIEDYVVKLVVNEQPDGAIVDAYVTDIYGNTKLSDYTTALYDELNANGTAITGGKRWWGKFVRQKIRKEEEEKKKDARNTSICVCVNVCTLLRQAKITSNR
jgi:hypothetical protein